MNYSPDYNMRRRNQDCGCSRNMTWEYDTRQNSGMSDYSRSIQTRTSGCGCMEKERMTEKEYTERNRSTDKRIMDCIDTFPVGMTYTPWQVWQELYEIDEALSVGTIFRELDYPWEVGRCAKCR